MDPREAILARLLIVAGSVDTSLSQRRNETDVSGSNLPAVILFDGEENNAGEIPKRRLGGPPSPQIIEMMPEVQFRLEGKAPEVGTKLNLLRGKLIDAVLADSALLALTSNGVSIRYEGSRTATERGRSMEGGIGVAFTFTYLLRPGQVAG
ncbi:MAG: hypothetical protein EOR77_21620 [Mesorhizobium sp.]|uniref:hypothetical protein n=1 Tax=Mesorhizobium sp. TaxID=1871066 RepID=UPI000FE4D5D6|nr:hypothetical protein [Mesorhizobium sp.]RWH86450.1 MAG: hypothetical protein EOQ87_26525 [Mesorhizobium sp.]RWM32274.1 MAG: hypothetical protein EOR77_21620 [Mesorhizobium sp.]TJV33774.1 MAG: hypothetical protein E5X87_10600 [Mesorhizobium sp.]